MRKWERESNERENEKKKNNFNNNFLNFFNYKKKKQQNDIVLAHLTAIDNWGLMEYRIYNSWKLEDLNDKNKS